MKGPIEKIFFGLIIIYLTGMSIAIPYYNWTYSKQNGFISWLLLGEFSATGKGLIWPYFVYSENFRTKNQIDNSVRLPEKRAVVEVCKNEYLLTRGGSPEEVQRYCECHAKSALEAFTPDEKRYQAAHDQPSTEYNIETWKADNRNCKQLLEPLARPLLERQCIDLVRARLNGKPLNDAGYQFCSCFGRVAFETTNSPTEEELRFKAINGTAPPSLETRTWEMAEKNCIVPSKQRGASI